MDHFRHFEIIQFRDKLYTKFKSCRVSNPSYALHKSRLNDFNKLLKKTIKEAKSNYYNNEFSKYSDNITKSRQTINEILNRDRKSDQFPTHIVINDNKISDEQEIADHFNNYFASIGETFADKIPKSKYSYEKYLNNTILSSCSFQTIEQGTVKTYLTK